MIIDLGFISESIKGFGFMISFLAGPILWDSGCEVDESRTIIKRCFGSKLRSIAASEIVNAIAIAVAVLLAPWNAPALVLQGALWATFVLLIAAPALFLNLHRGGFSHAPRDSARRHQLLAAYKAGTLDRNSLRRNVGCILKEVVRGNEHSARIMSLLIRRTDSLGTDVRENVIELSEDLEATSQLLGIELKPVDTA